MAGKSERAELTKKAKALALAIGKKDQLAVAAQLSNDPSLAEHSLPFTEACRSGNYDSVVSLLDAGADVHITKGAGPKGAEKPLIWTVRAAKWSEGHKKVAELLLAKGADINAGLALEEVTPLIAAAERGHREAVDLLIEHGATVGFYEAVMLADTGLAIRQLGENHSLAAEVRKSGVGVHNIRGTALHFAAISALGNSDSAVADRLANLAETLLDRGSPLNGGEIDGLQIPAPVSAAARAGNTAVLSVLLARGADPAEALKPGLASGSEEILAILAKYPINPDETGDSKLGNTLLHEMIRYGKLTAARWLLDRGAFINAVDTNGWSALHYAARRGVHPDFFETLISQGADHGALDANGAAPRDIASNHKRQNLVDLLDQL